MVKALQLYVNMFMSCSKTYSQNSSAGDLETERFASLISLSGVDMDCRGHVEHNVLLMLRMLKGSDIMEKPSSVDVDVFSNEIELK